VKLHRLKTVAASNRSLLWVIPCISIALLLAFTGFGRSTKAELDWSETSPTPVSDDKEPIQALKPITGLNQDQVALGRKLFHDPSLSRNGQVSCASCHDLATGGADKRIVPVGINGAPGVVNSPSVFNSAYNFSLFWDGRAPNLEAQMDAPIQSATEMGTSWPELIRKLKNSPEYNQSFHRIFQDEIKICYVKNSIATFERSLSTPNSRFDRYLLGHRNSLTAEELEGYKLFKAFGCVSCHQGRNIGGNMYQKLGVMAPYFTERGHITRADRGRFNVTGNPNDLYMFKVPSLRNVALTAPYFHDGAAPTLPQAVEMMAKYQLGRHLSDGEVVYIVKFLNTLTGELNGKPL
jgi:cytochrome c peroxidase